MPQVLELWLLLIACREVIYTSEIGSSEGTACKVGRHVHVVDYHINIQCSYQFRSPINTVLGLMLKMGEMSVKDRLGLMAVDDVRLYFEVSTNVRHPVPGGRGLWIFWNGRILVIWVTDNH